MLVLNTPALPTFSAFSTHLQSLLSIDWVKWSKSIKLRILTEKRNGPVGKTQFALNFPANANIPENAFVPASQIGPHPLSGPGTTRRPTLFIPIYTFLSHVKGGPQSNGILLSQKICDTLETHLRDEMKTEPKHRPAHPDQNSERPDLTLPPNCENQPGFTLMEFQPPSGSSSKKIATLSGCN